MITKEMILIGIARGVVKLIDSPNDGEPACLIGEHWFYYAGSEGCGKTSEEYVSEVPMDDITREIIDALEGIRDGLSEDEYAYYETVLREAGVGSGKEESRMNGYLRLTYDVNNGQTITLVQEKHDGDVIVIRDEEGKRIKERIIPAGVMIMLLNFYRYIKDFDIQNDFINPGGRRTE